MVSYRPATPDDAPSVRAVARRSWHEAYDALVGPETVEETVDEWYDPASLSEQIREATCFRVAEDGDRDPQVVGFVHGEYDGEDPAELPRLYVDPDHWGQGVGSALLSTTERTLREAGAGALRLSVLADNDVGRPFYESRGFEAVEGESSTLGVDALVLRKEL